MRDPFSGPEGTLLNSQPHALIGMGLAIHVPATVWTGTISSYPAFPANGTGVGQASVTTVTGSPASVKVGMTVVVGNYITVVRKVPIVGTLYIDGLGEGTASGTGFAVYNEYFPQPYRIRYVAPDWFTRFDIPYVAQNEDFGPQAVMGPSAVIYADGSQTFNFDGTRSIAHTPGSTIASYLWTFPDSTTSASSAPTWATSTAYPDGEYVHLLVTDSNGDTHEGHRLLFKFDSSNPPKTDFEVTGYVVKGWGDGAECMIHTMDSTMEAAGGFVRAKNHVVLFGTTAYGSTVQNIGGNFPDRGNIWMDGWITDIEAEWSHEGTRYTYTINTVDEMLRLQDAFPIYLEDNATPTKWIHMKDLSLNMVALHLAKHRSNLLDIVDMTFCSETIASDPKFAIDIGEGTLWDQLQQIAYWVYKGTWSVDEQSGMYFEQDAMVADNVATLPAAFSLFSTNTTIQDGYIVADVPLYIKRNSQVTLYAVDYDLPKGTRAPDDPRAHGAGRETIQTGVMGTQTEINVWAGNYRAKLNSTTGIRRYPLIGIIRISPVPQSTISIDAAATYTRIVRAMEIEFDHENGMAWVTIDCEVDTTGAIAGQPVSFTVLA